MIHLFSKQEWSFISGTDDGNLHSQLMKKEICVVFD